MENFTINIDGVEVTSNEKLDEVEAVQYINYIRTNNSGRKPNKVILTFDGDDVNLEYWIPSRPFEKIRRITGYLVGTLDRFNNAKAEEEHDRVKHA